MKRTPESLLSGGGEQEEGKDLSAVRDKRLGSTAMVAGEGDATESAGGEVLEKAPRAVDIVHDHFPEDISPREHFERDFGPNPLKTEEDYKKAFDLFLQEELVKKYHNGHGGGYNLVLTYRSYMETVHAYLEKTRGAVKDLAGESGKLPETDVAIYLDKSARPVSWFVNEFWEDFTDKPKPQTEHLAIDRRHWFGYFKVEIDLNEHIEEEEGKRLAGWRDLPIHDVTQEEMGKLWKLLRDEVITHEELEVILNGTSDIDNRIRGRAIDAAYEDNDVKNRVARREITNEELELYKKEALERVEILNNKKRLKNIYDACMIAARLRGLFVPGGLSEEDVNHPERIMDYPVDMEGKNITIIDEVARTGTTGEVAKHFIEWAFPEAASVNFYVFYEAKKLHDANSPMDGQMLMIPFWYSLAHDDGAGRGINGRSVAFYEKKYSENPSNNTRAEVFGADFLGTPMVYGEERGEKSLRLRKQINRLRAEYEKGHIR